MAEMTPAQLRSIANVACGDNEQPQSDPSIDHLKSRIASLKQFIAILSGVCFGGVIIASVLCLVRGGSTEVVFLFVMLVPTRMLAWGYQSATL